MRSEGGGGKDDADAAASADMSSSSSPRGGGIGDSPGTPRDHSPGEHLLEAPGATSERASAASVTLAGARRHHGGGAVKESSLWRRGRGLWHALIACGLCAFLSCGVLLLRNGGAFRNAAQLAVHPVFGAVYQVLALSWMYAMAVSLWEPHGIPYRQLLRLGRRKKGTYDAPQLMLVCAFMSLLFSALFLLYSVTMRGRDTLFPVAVIPALTFFLTPLWAVLPVGRLFFDRGSRHAAVLRTLYQSVLIPFYGVEFVHVIAADVLTSATWLLWDLDYSLCILVTGAWARGGSTEETLCADPRHLGIAKPVLFAAPFLLRFLQCLFKAWQTQGLVPSGPHATFSERWPHTHHYWNAAKYLTGIIVVASSTITARLAPGRARDAMYSVWLCATIVKTVSCILWDTLMDYGLLRPRSRRHPWLRDTLLFRSRAAYTLALVSNALARGTFARALGPQPKDVDYQLFYALVEIARRGLWLVFRVEHEHSKRTEGGGAAEGRPRADTMESLEDAFAYSRTRWEESSDSDDFSL